MNYFPVEDISSKEALGLSYDAVLVSYGYESRATFFSSLLPRIPSRACAVGYSWGQEIAFQKNLASLRDMGYACIQESPDRRFTAIVSDFLEELVQTTLNTDSDTVRIAIDISCMSRQRIIQVVQSLFVLESRVALDVVFFYAPSWTTTPDIAAAKVERMGPATPFFAGWSLKPELPSATFLGLGQTQGRASSVDALFEPKETWLFVPTGGDLAGERKVLELHSSLIDRFQDRVIAYPLHRPLEILGLLDSAVSSYLYDFRPIIFPSGPKLFALVSALVAVKHHPIVALWLVAAGRYGIPVDRPASGELMALRVLVNQSVGTMPSGTE